MYIVSTNDIMCIHHLRICLYVANKKKLYISLERTDYYENAGNAYRMYHNKKDVVKSIVGAIL